MTSNRYVNETENRTLTTPRQRPEDAKDAAAFCLSDVHPPPAVLGDLGALAVDAVGPFRLRITERDSEEAVLDLWDQF